jgi:hypothetical protein
MVGSFLNDGEEAAVAGRGGRKAGRASVGGCEKRS